MQAIPKFILVKGEKYIKRKWILGKKNETMRPSKTFSFAGHFPIITHHLIGFILLRQQFYWMGANKIICNKCAHILVGQEVYGVWHLVNNTNIFKEWKLMKKIKKKRGSSKISFVLYLYVVENSPIMNFSLRNN